MKELSWQRRPSFKQLRTEMLLFDQICRIALIKE